MLLNLVVLYYIVGVALPPSKQEGHFAIALIANNAIIKNVSNVVL